MPIGDATREPAISPRLAPMPIGDASAASRVSSGQPRTIIQRMRAHQPKLNHYEIADDDAAAAGVLDAAVGIAVVPSTSA